MELDNLFSKANKRQFREMMDKLPAVIYTTDAEGRLTYYNSTAVEFSGREPQLGSDQWCVTWKLYHPDGTFMPHDKCPMAKSLQEGRSINGAKVIAEFPDGERIWFEAYSTPLRDDEGNIRGGINMLLDITERKKAEKLLSQNEQKFTDLFNNATVGIHFVGPDGIIQHANQSELELLGYSREEYVGSHIADHHVDQDVIEDILEKLSSGEELDNREARLRCKDGSIKHVIISSNVYWQDGEFVHTRCFTRDITKRKRTEKLHKERNKLLELIASDAPLEKCFSSLSNTISRLSSGVRVSVMFADEQGQSFNRPIAPDFPPSYSEELEGAPISDPAIGTCGEAVYKNQKVICQDIANNYKWSDEWRNLCLSHDISACFSQPIYSKHDQPVGSFMLCFDKPREPDEWEHRIAEFGAHVASIAYESDRSQRALRKSKDHLASWGKDLERLHDLSTRLLMKEDVEATLHEVMTACTELLHADKSSVQIYDEQNEVLKLVSRLGFDEAFDQQFGIVDTDSITTCAAALRQQKQVLVEDLSNDPAYAQFYRTAKEYNARAAFSTPLYGNEDQLLGMFTMYWNNPHQPTDKELQLLDLYTQQAARQIERKRSEEALRESEERFRALVTASSDIVYRMSPDWSEMRHLVGRDFLADTQEPSSRWLDRYIHPDDQERIKEAINEAIATKSMFELEHRVQQVDGTTGWTYSRAIPILDDNNEIIEWFGAAKDVTDRKRAEEKLREINETLEERVEERTESLLSYQDQLRSLASQLSKAEEEERQRLATELHDNLGQMLVMGKMKIDALQNEQLSEEVFSELDNLRGLIEDSLSYTRNLMSNLKPPPALNKEDVRATIEWLVKKMEEQHDLEIILDDDKQPKRTSEEIRTTLLQCTRELLFNVLKHAAVNKARIEMSRVDSQVQIVVEDNGQGFDPATSTSMATEEGRFGLFNIRERIDLLGGSTEIYSEPGEGTRVKLTAPVKETKQSELKKKSPQDEVEGSPQEDKEVIKVMLVDDHEMMRKGLKEIVDEEDDLKVIAEASDGEEAIKLARKFSPDVIIMDVNMPRMDGIEATNEILSIMPDTKIIGLSLHDDKEVRDSIRSAGASAYLSKNEAFKTLCATIRSEAS